MHQESINRGPNIVRMGLIIKREHFPDQYFPLTNLPTELLSTDLIWRAGM